MIIELDHNKSNRMICVPSDHSDQPAHLHSPIRVIAVHLKKPWVLKAPSED